MPEVTLPIENLIGLAETPYFGDPENMAKSWGVDYRSEPGIVKLARTLDVEEDNTGDVDDLPMWVVQDYDGDIYWQGNTGRLMRRASGGTDHTLIKAVSSSTGEGLGIHTISSTRYLLYAQDALLGRVALPDAISSSTFTDNYQTLNSADYHPMEGLSNLMCIGNDYDLATLDDAGNFDADRVKLATGFHIRTLAVTNEFLAIGAWRGQNFYTSEGRIYFWDGRYGNWNRFLSIPDGGPSIIIGGENELLIIAGGKGAIYRWQPSSGLRRIGYLPKDWTASADLDGIVALNPGAGCYWDGLYHLGVGNGASGVTAAGSTTAEDVKEGVYTFGSNSPYQKDSLNVEYRICADDSNSHDVGCVRGFGPNDLFVSHKQVTSVPATTYDIKRRATDSTPYSTASGHEGIINTQFQDFGEFWKRGVGVGIKYCFEPLSSGGSIQLKIYVDGSSSVAATYTAYTTASGTEDRQPISVDNFREVMAELILSTSSAGVTPRLRNIAIVQESEASEV